MPDGVVNVVTGFGETAGAALAAHPGRGQGRLHRLHRGRQADRAGGGRQPEEGDAWNWAASRRTSSSTTPTSTPPSRARPTPSSSTTASAAAPARGCSSSRRSSTRWSTASPERARRSSSDRAWNRETQMGPLVSEEQFQRVTRLPRSRASRTAPRDVAGGRPARRPRLLRRADRADQHRARR